MAEGERGRIDVWEGEEEEKEEEDVRPSFSVMNDLGPASSLSWFL